MLSHPLEEVRQIGAEIKVCATKSVPTLLKYAGADESLMTAILPVSSPNLPTISPEHDWCQLIYSEQNLEIVFWLLIIIAYTKLAMRNHSNGYIRLLLLRKHV